MVYTEKQYGYVLSPESKTKSLYKINDTKLIQESRYNNGTDKWRT